MLFFLVIILFGITFLRFLLCTRNLVEQTRKREEYHSVFCNRMIWLPPPPPNLYLLALCQLKGEGWGGSQFQPWGYELGNWDLSTWKSDCTLLRLETVKYLWPLLTVPIVLLLFLFFEYSYWLMELSHLSVTITFFHPFLFSFHIPSLLCTSLEEIPSKGRSLVCFSN